MCARADIPRSFEPQNQRCPLCAILPTLPHSYRIVLPLRIIPHSTHWLSAMGRHTPDCSSQTTYQRFRASVERKSTLFYPVIVLKCVKGLLIFPPRTSHTLASVPSSSRPQRKRAKVPGLVLLRLSPSALTRCCPRLMMAVYVFKARSDGEGEIFLAERLA